MMGTGRGAGTRAGSGTERGVGSGIGAGSGTGRGVGTGVGAGTGAGSGPGVGPGTGMGAGRRPHRHSSESLVEGHEGGEGPQVLQRPRDRTCEDKDAGSETRPKRAGATSRAFLTEEADGGAQLAAPGSSGLRVELLQALHQVPVAHLPVPHVALPTGAPEGRSHRGRCSEPGWAWPGDPAETHLGVAGPTVVQLAFGWQELGRHASFRRQEPSGRRSKPARHSQWD